MKVRLISIIALAGYAAVPISAQVNPSQQVMHELRGHASGPGNLTVDCSKSQTIGAALKKLSPTGPNTVTVDGICNENVLIQGIDRLTLITTTGAQIHDASGGLSPVVHILDSRSVTLQGFTINGGDRGVACRFSGACYLIGNSIGFATGLEAIVVSDGSKAFLSNNVIHDNSHWGLAIRYGAQVFSGADSFESNGGHGVVVVSGAYLAANTSTFRNNGNSGVSVRDRSALDLFDCTISGNAGIGVALINSAEARFEGSGTITANGASGVQVSDLSFANFEGDWIVTGNLGGTDVVCAPQFPATRGAASIGGTTNCVEP